MKFVVGVKVTVPSAFSVTLPLATATESPAAMLLPLIASTAGVPSGSLSLPVALIVTGVSSCVAALSSAATVGCSTGRT